MFMNISPPLCKQTHVNNVINRHLIFVKCLFEFWVKRTNRKEEEEEERRPINPFKCFVILKENISSFQMSLCFFFVKVFMYIYVALFFTVVFFLHLCLLPIVNKRKIVSIERLLFPSFYWKLKRQICICKHDFLIILFQFYGNGCSIEKHDPPANVFSFVIQWANEKFAQKYLPN